MARRPSVSLVVLASMAGFLGSLTTAGDALEPPTVQDVLRKNFEARGGPEAWARLTTLETEGTWTAFSMNTPMTIVRKRPDLFRFDHVLFDTPAVLAYDGRTAWVQGAMYEAPDGQALTESWSRNVVEEAPFGPLLQHYAASGAAITLDGRARVEGQDVWVLRVAPKGLPPETWYLDVATYLEVKRVSPTYDVFSGPDVELEMETFYMDFRELAGVKIPYREERHFGTRYRVYEAASITANPEVDPSVFRLAAKEPGPSDEPAVE